MLQCLLKETSAGEGQGARMVNARIVDEWFLELAWANPKEGGSMNMNLVYAP